MGVDIATMSVIITKKITKAFLYVRHSLIRIDQRIVSINILVQFHNIIIICTVTGVHVAK